MEGLRLLWRHKTVFPASSARWKNNMAPMMPELGLKISVRLIFCWNLPGNRALSYSDFYLVNKLMHLECLLDREAWWNWTYRRWKATRASAKQTLQVILKISLNQVCFSRLVKVIITTTVSLHACAMSCLSTAWIDDFSMLPFEWTWGWAGCACFESNLLLFLCKLPYAKKI